LIIAVLPSKHSTNQFQQHFVVQQISLDKYVHWLLLLDDFMYNNNWFCKKYTWKICKFIIAVLPYFSIVRFPTYCLNIYIYSYNNNQLTYLSSAFLPKMNYCTAHNICMKYVFVTRSVHVIFIASPHTFTQFFTWQI
jgi:hypothetical protein